MSEAPDITLLPMPRSMKRRGEFVPVDVPVTERMDAQAVPQAQGYRLTLAPGGIELLGHDEGGLFYGRCTLAQLRSTAGRDGSLPGLVIDDWPDFERRGVMLDISRDKVPTMATLFRLVDALASWKINQLQLYTEHTFAYTNHRTVWEHASPMTAEQVRELDTFCRARHVTLVANQNTLGHMERWLKHERYRPLAERDDQRHRFAACLCPIDPGSIALVEELLGELAPCFASDTINVGLDETFQIGTGRSAHVCAERGVGRVYADYLLKVHAIAERMGKRIQFWADMVLGYDDVPAMIPADATAMVWGYEADHPFERQARQMASVGLPFYVCPGSSAWNSITGRTANMLTNVDAAVAAGLSHGAAGLLQTDWGDNGHLQPLPISYPGYAYAAARSWCAASNDASKLASQIDAHVLYDRAGRAGAWLLEAGDVALLLNQPRKNGTPLFDLLMTDGRAEKLDVERERYAACREALATLRQGVDGFDLQRDDAGQVAEELRWACDLLIAACDRGLGQLDAATVHELTDRHRQLWLQRNRPGGLDDSVGRLNRLADAIA